MNSFNIKYVFTNKNRLNEYILKYPETSANTLTSTSAHLLIYMNRKLISTPNIVNQDFSCNVWMLDFCRNLLKVVNLEYDTEVTIRLSVEPGCLKVTKMNGTNKIKFLSEFGAANDEVYGEIVIPYADLLKESYKILDSFCKDLLKINKEIINLPEFKQIIEGRDKIKQMLEARK